MSENNLSQGLVLNHLRPVHKTVSLSVSVVAANIQVFIISETAFNLLPERAEIRKVVNQSLTC